MWPAKRFLSTLSLRRATNPRFFSSFFWLFLSTLSLRRATGSLSNGMTSTSYFYPRSPCGERLHYDNYNLHCVDISIHALLAESDLLSKDAKDGPVLISIHALLAESDSRLHYSDFSRLRFLSTLSLRRATRGKVYMRTVSLFLSTLSLRRATRAANCQQRNHQISIHALLAESDPLLMFWLFRLSRFLSTLSLRRATQCRRPRPRPRFISIHALLAESDRVLQKRCHEFLISIHALLAESDSKPRALKSRRMVFLSTLSLRRATNLPSSPIDRKLYFYPRSPCGERPKVNFLIFDPSAYFYPRSPCGERHTYTRTQSASLVISIHALLAESDERKS